MWAKLLPQIEHSSRLVLYQCWVAHLKNVFHPSFYLRHFRMGNDYFSSTWKTSSQTRAICVMYNHCSASLLRSGGQVGPTAKSPFGLRTWNRTKNCYLRLLILSFWNFWSSKLQNDKTITPFCGIASRYNGMSTNAKLLVRERERTANFEFIRARWAWCGHTP